MVIISYIDQYPLSHDYVTIDGEIPTADPA